MKTNFSSLKNQKGFSLMELVIASSILLMILGILSTIMLGVNKSYTQQQPRIEAINETTAVLNLMSRLIRMAGNNPNGISGLHGIDPGTAVGGHYKTIRIRSDWHGTTLSSPPDGDTADSLEDITFTVSSGILMKQEQPADTAPVEFLDNINDLRFTYFDTNNILITDPVTNQTSIARVDIEIEIKTPDTPAMTFRSSVHLRGK